MIRDIFHKRYKEIYFPFYDNFMHETVPEDVVAFFKISAHIIFHDLIPLMYKSDEIFKKTFNAFTRELGVTNIAEGRTYQDICINYLLTSYNVWGADYNPSDYIKKRISLIELIFSSVEEELEIKSKQDSLNTFNHCIEELNQRLREARLFFYYQNKSIDTYNDKLSQKNIYEPFWEILKNEKYQIIDSDIRKAFERFNSNQPDAAFYAMKALESCVKIISDELGLSTGNEKGATNYIDNLLSKKNKIIDPWEAESLKLLFREIRNPLGHGSGNEKPIELKFYQMKCVIDISIVWIKSLIIRLT